LIFFSIHQSQTLHSSVHSRVYQHSVLSF